MIADEIKKKVYIKPEIEVIVFNYKDVVAASGVDFSLGVGGADTEIGSALGGVSSQGEQSDSSVWDTGTDGGSSDGE